MTDSLALFLFAAVHKGPYLSIVPLEAELGADRIRYLVEGVSKIERSQKGLPYVDMEVVESWWGSLERFLVDTGVKAVIRSSSEYVAERNVEELSWIAAGKVGIPVFVIEDFPGNYWPKPDERIDGLFVEDDSMIELYRSRGVDSQIIYASGNLRYNALVGLDRMSRRSETRRALGLDDEPAVLWAGQPDGDNSYRALGRLLEHFDGAGTTLLFRAHPRDEAYNAGAYSELQTNTSMKVVDTSSYPNVLDLYCASDLVVTQFSSAGVEASYLGVPALFVLFEDLGKEYLRTSKGYDSLPWCSNGCAFLIESEMDIKSVMEQAVFDADARDQVRSNFQRRFVARADGARIIGDRIQEAMGGGA